MSLVRYTDLDVLILDDQPEARSYTRDMLREFGSRHVDTVSSGDEALQMMRENRYGLVLADYNLGDGRDGQQVLEEVRHGGLLPQTSAFVMITADTSPEMVMGALEYHPDGYIMKPYTRSDLRKRLTRLLEAKQALFPIESELENERYQHALAACDQTARRHPDQLLPALRHKGALLLMLGRLEEAEKLYSTVLGKRMLPWAQLGLGKTLLELGKLDEAAEAFRTLIAENNAYVEAHDWLARIYVKQGKDEEAQKELLTATEVSPKAVKRQMELARIAEKNEAWDVSEKAYRRSISLGRHSVYRNPANYVGLVNVVEKTVNDRGLRDKRKAGDESLRLLKEADRIFEDREVRCRVAALRARTCRTHGKTAEGDAAEKRAQDLLAKLENPPEELRELVAGESRELTAEQAAFEQCENLNNQGVELFQKGRTAEAYKLFRQAVNSTQASMALLMNTLQAVLVLAREKQAPEDWRTHVTDYLTRLEVMGADDPHRERLGKLKKMYQQIK